MKNNLRKLATVVVMLFTLVPGLAMLLAGCGPAVTPRPISVAPNATMQGVSPTDTPLPPTILPTDTPIPTIQPTDTLVPTPTGTEAGGLIDDFEGSDFDDRWWFHTNEEADPSTNLLRANFVFRAFRLKYRSSSGRSRNTA